MLNREATDTKPSRAAGNHGTRVLCQKMALLVEALHILFSGIWSFSIAGGLRVILPWCGSIAVTRGMFLTIFSKLQGWRKILDMIFFCNHDDKKPLSLKGIASSSDAIFWWGTPAWRGGVNRPLPGGRRKTMRAKKGEAEGSCGGMHDGTRHKKRLRWSTAFSLSSDVL